MPTEQFRGGVMPTTEPDATANEKQKEKEIVIMLATDFRLTEVLMHIEAGRIVYVIPAPRSPTA
jgi:hypothetical protein